MHKSKQYHIITLIVAWESHPYCLLIVYMMQVEDTRRVTQAALVIVDDSDVSITVYSSALKYTSISRLDRSR